MSEYTIHTVPVTMTSLLSGKTHTRNYRMTAAQINAYTTPGRVLTQDIFPELSLEDRELLMTGITPEEWNATFPKEEDND